MRGKGICYDTGFFNRGVSTHEPFDPQVVARELRVIREDLHCNAVRLTGGDLERLKLAAGHAAVAGLEVWISPFTTDLTSDELLDLLAGCAEHAERLRRRGAEVVLLTGSELTVCNQGIVPGETFEERVRLLTPSNPSLGELLAAVPARVNDLLATAVRVVRERFGGKVSYASLPFERVDWTPFDVVSTDAGYRSAATADRYADNVRALVAQGKPVAITEFGCCTYKGAADRGGGGTEIVEWDAATVTPVRLDGDYTRDEDEQATYLREVLDILTAEGSTARSCTPSPATTCPTAATLAWTWTGPAPAWSRSWRAAAAAPTPTWPGSPRPPSPRSPTTTAADIMAGGGEATGRWHDRGSWTVWWSAPDRPGWPPAPP
jgi:hypothetical protein